MRDLDVPSAAQVEFSSLHQHNLSHKSNGTFQWHIKQVLWKNAVTQGSRGRSYEHWSSCRRQVHLTTVDYLVHHSAHKIQKQHEEFIDPIATLIKIVPCNTGKQKISEHRTLNKGLLKSDFYEVRLPKNEETMSGLAGN